MRLNGCQIALIGNGCHARVSFRSLTSTKAVWELRREMVRKLWENGNDVKWIFDLKENSEFSSKWELIFGLFILRALWNNSCALSRNLQGTLVKTGNPHTPLAHTLRRQSFLSTARLRQRTKNGKKNQTNKQEQRENKQAVGRGCHPHVWLCFHFLF